MAAFRERAANETKRFSDATDSEYWVALCFHSREEKERWLRDSGLDALGDKYLDGSKIEAKLR